MNTKAFTAALVALALMSGCAPTQPSTAGAGPGGAPAGGAQAGGPPAGGFQGGGRPGGFGGQGGFGGGRSAVITVQTEVVKSGTLWVENTTAGAVIAEVQSTVAAGSSGTVKTLLRQVGDWVEAGTPVVQLDDTQLKLSLRLAQATLDNARVNAGVSEGASGVSKLGLQVQSAQSALASAQKNFASAQALAKVGGISGSDLDNAQTQLQNAQANLESAKMALTQSGLQVETATIQLQQAQLNLANATIKAPYAGQISAISLHPGEFVGTSTAAFSLVSRTKVISFGVSPSEAPGLSLGSAVTFTYGGKKANTKVTQAPSAPVNGLVPLTAALPVGIDAPLGTVGTLSYRLPAAEGVLVPLPALQSAENKTFVFTSNQGKAQRHEVTVLGDSGTYTAVSGIASGVTVIVNPPPGLLVGATVKEVGQNETAVGTTGAAGGQPGQASGQRRQQPADGSAQTVPAGGQAPQSQAQGQWNGQRRQQPADDSTQMAPADGQAPQGQGQGQWNGQRRQQPTDGSAQTAPADGQAPQGQGQFQGQRRQRPAEGSTDTPSTGGQ